MVCVRIMEIGKPFYNLWLKERENSPSHCHLPGPSLRTTIILIKLMQIFLIIKNFLHNNFPLVEGNENQSEQYSDNIVAQKNEQCSSRWFSGQNNQSLRNNPGNIVEQKSVKYSK